MLHNRFWQGFFALAPIILMIIGFIGYFSFILLMFSNFETLEQHPEKPPMEMFGGMFVFFIFILLASVVAIASLVFYIMHAVQNPNLKENNLLLVWILLFVFVGGIGKIIYWFVEIINKREPKSLNQKT